MKGREVKEWPGTIVVLIFMVLIPIATVSLSPTAADRATQALGWVIKKLQEGPRQRTPEEIRERWRVTRPGMILSKDYVPKSEAPGLRALEAAENSPPGSRPIQQASGSYGSP